MTTTKRFAEFFATPWPAVDDCHIVRLLPHETREDSVLQAVEALIARIRPDWEFTRCDPIVDGSVLILFERRS